MTKYLWKYELYHHGIKGQQWGVRNGPPYPLSRVDHNKVVKKGLTGSTDKQTKDKPHNKSSVLRSVARIAGGASYFALGAYMSTLSTTAVWPVAGAMLIGGGGSVIVGGVGLVSASVRAAIKKYADGADKRAARHERMQGAVDYKKNTSQVSSSDELKGLRGTYNSDNIIKDLTDINPGYGFAERSTSNCAQCSLAYIMRKNGYNVIANNRIGDSEAGWSAGVTNKEILHALGYDATWKTRSDGTKGYDGYASCSGAKVGSPVSVKTQSVADAMKAASTSTKSNSDTYILGLTDKYGCGHSVIVESSKGKTNIIDAQSGDVNPIDVYFSNHSSLAPSDVIAANTPDKMENGYMASYLRKRN